MKKADLIEVTIRILGLYLFVSTISHAIEGVLAWIPIISFNQGTTYGNQNEILTYWVIGILNIVLTFSIALFLIFGAKSIVRKICRHEDFEENVKLFAEPKEIYQIAIILSGLLLIIWTLEEVSWQIKYYLMSQKLYDKNQYSETDFRRLWVSISRIIIGIFLIQLSKSISEYFGKRKILNDKQKDE